MKEVYDYFFTYKELSPPTRAHYEKVSRSFDVKTPLDKLKREEVRKYHANLDLKDTTKHQYINALGAMADFYISDHEAIPNPFKGLVKAPSRAYQRAKSLEKTISNETLDKIRTDKFKGINELYRLTALFQANTGFSWVDLGSPHWEIEEKVITLRRGKNCQESVIPISEELRGVLTEWERPFMLFVDMDFNIDSKTYNREYRRYSRFLKRYGITAHQLRHYFGMSMLNKNGKWTLDEVGMMMGHESVNTTRSVYANVKRERILSKL